MAKRKRSGRPPQAQHCGKSKLSQFDKRQRLAGRNPERRRTEQASVPLTGGVAVLADAMSRLLDKRIAFRLPILLAGAMLAGGRRTAASWFRCAGVKDDWDRFYELLQTLGKNAASLLARPNLGVFLARSMTRRSTLARLNQSVHLVFLKKRFLVRGTITWPASRGLASTPYRCSNEK